VISDIAESVERVMDIRKRASDITLSRDEIWKYIKKEKKDLDCLRSRADLVLWNDFSTKEKFVHYARAQIMAFME